MIVNNTKVPPSMVSQPNISIIHFLCCVVVKNKLSVESQKGINAI